MKTENMWTVWDAESAYEDDSEPLCYCETEDDAWLVQEHMCRTDTIVRAPEAPC